MTKDKDEKVVIRARMARTGESYAAARAQLAKAEPEAKTGPGELPRMISMRTTGPADSALNAARRVMGGPWELLLALRQTKGIASAVLTDLGLEARSYDQWLRETGAAGAEAERSALLEKVLAVAASLVLEKEDKRVDSGVLLRAAVSLLADVPAQSAGVAARLKQVDLVALCAAAERQSGPEDLPRDAEANERVGMFERFTDKARQAIVMAQEEARGLDHHYIGTEHLLLGLLHLDDAVAAKVLTSMGVSLSETLRQVEEMIGRGSTAPEGHIPFTPRAKKVMELSLRSALELNHNYIGTEHLLLGLLVEGEGVAATVLLQHQGVTLESVRAKVIEVLKTHGKGEPS